MCSWFIVIFLGLFVTLGEFSRRFLKCSFPFCICFCWPAAFSFAVEVLFLLLASFTVCHAIRDYIPNFLFYWSDSAVPFYLFLIHFVSLHVVHPHSSIGSTVVWQKFRFILSDRLDFHMIDSRSIAVYVFARCILILLNLVKLARSSHTKDLKNGTWCLA